MLSVNPMTFSSLSSIEVLPGGQRVCSEVAVMKTLMAKARSMSAFVALLDWYDLDTELILILERPVPCQDLFDYCVAKGGSLQEEEAKVSCWDVALATGSKCLFYFHNDPLLPRFKPIIWKHALYNVSKTWWTHNGRLPSSSSITSPPLVSHVSLLLFSLSDHTATISWRWEGAVGCFHLSPGHKDGKHPDWDQVQGPVCSGHWFWPEPYF